MNKNYLFCFSRLGFLSDPSLILTLPDGACRGDCPLTLSWALYTHSVGILSYKELRMRLCTDRHFCGFSKDSGTTQVGSGRHFRLEHPAIVDLSSFLSFIQQNINILGYDISKSRKRLAPGPAMTICPNM